MNILLVMETRGYLMLALQEKLRIKEYETLAVQADINAINRVQLPLDAILIYMDERMKTKQNVLVYLRDKAIEDELPVFLIGDNDELTFIQKLFPADLIASTFLRPLNVVAVCETLNSYLREKRRTTQKKILVVDASDAMLDDIRNWLGNRYELILVNSGSRAIQYLDQNSRPDLVLLDYEMPDCDGKEVLTKIRKEKTLANLPVMFLTEKSDRESVMNVMALKPEKYLLKTMKPEQIIATIDAFFAKGKSMLL